MEATLDGIFIIDAKKADFPVIYANPSFYKLIGYTKNEIIGQNYFLLYGSDADLRVVEEIKQTMRQGKSFHGEMLNFRKNGKSSGVPCALLQYAIQMVSPLITWEFKPILH